MLYMWCTSTEAFRVQVLTIEDVKVVLLLSVELEAFGVCWRQQSHTATILAQGSPVVAVDCLGAFSRVKATSQDDVAVGDSNAAVSSVCLSLHLNWSSLSTQKLVCDGIGERTSRPTCICTGNVVTTIINRYVIVDRDL